MIKNYIGTKVVQSKKTWGLGISQSLKMASLAIIAVFFASLSYGQCITGGNNTESVAYKSTTGGYSVTNPNNSTDGDLASFAAINVPIGIATTGHLAINFSKAANPGDTIYVVLGQGTGGLGSSVLSQTAATAYDGVATSSDPSVGNACGTQAASSLISLITILGIQYQALPVVVTGTAGAQSIDIAPSAFLSLSFEVDVYGVYVVPGPPTAVNGAACNNGSTGTLSGSYNTGTGNSVNFSFYSASTGGSALFTTAALSGTPAIGTYTASGLSATTTTFYVAENTSGCSLISPRKAVTVTKDPAVTSSIAVSCTGGGTKTNRLVATAGGGNSIYTYSWTPTASISGSSTVANPVITANTTYTVTIKDGLNCGVVQSATVTGVSSTTCANTPVVLPAIGLTLSGSVTAGKPVLTWSTLQEQNTSYFSIEASTSGTSFASIGKVSAAGISSSPSSYTFTDVTSIGSLVYYRVKLVDIDGNISYSNIFTLRLSGTAFAKVYPNPVTNLVNIETGAPGSYIVELFTVDGKKITSTQLSTASGLVTFNIDRTNVTSGLYLLKMTPKSGSTSIYNTIMVK